MYTNVIAALAVAVVLTVLALAYVTTMSSSQSYVLCKIAKITIQERGDMLYIASSRPTIIHVHLIYMSNNIEHTVCYIECQVAKAPLVVAVTPYDIELYGDVSILYKVLYLSPCEVTEYRPSCLSWIRLSDAKTSMPREL